MTPQQHSSDGVSQLTELMRHERVIEKRTAPPIDPQIRLRRRRRRRRLIVAAVVIAVLLASGGR